MRMQRDRKALAVVALVVPTPLGAGTGGPSAGARPLDLTVNADNGEGQIQQPGRPCDDGGDGAYWHYDYGTSLPAGILSNATGGEVRVHLDMHSDLVRFPNRSEE